MRVRAFLSFVGAVALAAAVVTAPRALADDRVVGGGDATRVYTFMASIQFEDGTHHCGGTLVGGRWVLTASHCLDRMTADGLRVRVGSKDRTQGGVLTKVERFTHHGSQDVAMVKPADEVKSGQLNVVRVPATGATVRLLGWGSRCDGGCGDRCPATLQQLDSTVVKADTCKNCSIDTSSEFCVQREAKDGGACERDNGGPAIENPDGQYWRLDGVLSRGANPCKPGPDVYVKVGSVIDWVRKQIFSSAAHAGPATGQWPDGVRWPSATPAR
ncbi:S1 family peptidase [Actinosynnema sp. NPDC053489]|uniref:S1 family peptidase n=1 Tax=Actinosynnema sp. NPDC053489 TaxID=3363916 RepID=UPI0037C7AC61